jgi:hypothetical protein
MHAHVQTSIIAVAQVHVWFGYATIALLLGQGLAGLWKYIVKVRDDRRIFKSHGHLGARGVRCSAAGGRAARGTDSQRACRARDIFVGDCYRHSGYVRNAGCDLVFAAVVDTLCCVFLGVGALVCVCVCMRMRTCAACAHTAPCRCERVVPATHRRLSRRYYRPLCGARACARRAAP